jgi:hypothetical protein
MSAAAMRLEANRADAARPGRDERRSEAVGG